ncbi:hypothetical protein NL676_035823 [Syzygium grande]|nr:hypothetical protein NL676_035823 [Syzygium grande]
MLHSAHFSIGSFFELKDLGDFHCRFFGQRVVTCIEQSISDELQQKGTALQKRFITQISSLPGVSIVTNGRANPEHKEVGRPLPGLHQPKEDNRRGQADLRDESMREPHLHRDQGLLQPSQAPFCNQGKQLMLHVAELVPRHAGRTKKQEPASTTSTGTSKSSKGRKKKR